MLADQLDYVVGVDPHRDTHALAIVDVRTGGVVLGTGLAASSSGYAHALELAKAHAPGRRAFAIEGAGSGRSFTVGARTTRLREQRGAARLAGA
jgi:transposase